MNDSRASLTELIERTSANLNVVADHLKDCVASADELMECSRLVFALADAVKLYAEKMPQAKHGGRHALRQQQPPST